MPFWTVAQTESQREHIAAQFLKQDHFEIYLPKILIRHGAHERVAPLFPGYLFVEIVERWWPVRWSVGVVRLLMADDHPARVSDRLMEAIKKREGRDGLIKLPKPRSLECGDQVKILRGSFEGRIGIYQGQSNAQRSRILLDLLGREVAAVIMTGDVARFG
jgi:transcriptional antiterminator RfaH